jgi:hypothetical protein
MGGFTITLFDNDTLQTRPFIGGGGLQQTKLDQKKISK